MGGEKAASAQGLRALLKLVIKDGTDVKGLAAVGIAEQGEGLQGKVVEHLDVPETGGRPVKSGGEVHREEAAARQIHRISGTDPGGFLIGGGPLPAVFFLRHGKNSFYRPEDGAS